jgi:hypothetical protein
MRFDQITRLCAIFVILIQLKMITPYYACNKTERSSPDTHGKIVLVNFFLLGLFIFSGGCSNDLPKEHKVVQAQDGVIRLPLKEVNDGNVHFFTYKQGKQPVNFFVRRDAAGNISACFDACFTCYKFRKGYRLEGRDLVCNECGLRFPTGDEKWDNSSGCSPIGVRSAKDNEYFIIKTGDLKKGGRLFNE